MVRTTFNSEKDLNPEKCYNNALKGDGWKKEVKYKYKTD